MLTAVSVLLSAKGIAEMWLTMPKEKTPYLTSKQKKELVDSYYASGKAQVINQLQKETVMDSLSVDYARITLSNAKELTMVMLPYKGDSIVMCISTYSAPEQQSVIHFYDEDWNLLPSQHMISETDISQLIACPDTMDTAEYEKLKAGLSPKFISYSFNPDTDELEVKLSVSLLSVEEKDKYSSLFRKRKLKWSGGMFN